MTKGREMSISFYVEGQPNFPNDVEVNVSNSNAYMILEDLGIEVDYCGAIEPADLKGRLLEALAMSDDSGFPSSTEVTPGGATFIDCGRRPGYKADRYTALMEVADSAAAYGVKVVWA